MDKRISLRSSGNKGYNDFRCQVLQEFSCGTCFCLFHSQGETNPVNISSHCVNYQTPTGPLQDHYRTLETPVTGAIPITSVTPVTPCDTGYWHDSGPWRDNGSRCDKQSLA